MKKLFALILAVVMICAMSVSVFAETKTEHVVGNRTGNQNGSYTEGAESLGSVAPTYNVSITAAVGEVQHRYAVDITYDVMTFDIASGNLVWNVNTLKYDVINNENTTIGENKTYNVTVTNYSDLPVNLAVAVTDHFDTTDKQDNVDVEAYYTVNSVETEYTGEEIASAIGASNDISGTAQTATFYIAVRTENGKSWNDVANYYANYFTANGGTSVDIATATITISKVTTNTQQPAN